MHQVGDQPRLYYDARSTNHQDQFLTLHYLYRYMCVQQSNKWQNGNRWETEAVNSSWPRQRSDSGAQVAVHPFERHLVPFNFSFPAMVHNSEPWFTSIKIRRYTVQCFNGDDADLCIRTVYSLHINEEINVNKCQHFTGFWTLGKSLAAIYAFLFIYYYTLR